MKRSFLSCFVTLLLLSTGLQLSAQTQPPPLKITHLTGDFYLYVTYGLYGKEYFPSNSMYLVTNKGVVMFDTPWDSAHFQPLLDSIEQRHHLSVVLSISTHFHEDRTEGIAFLQRKGISTWSSQQTYELCKQKGMHPATYQFTKDTTFHIGNHSFRTYYPGAGHAPDNIVVWFDQEKILYGGCFVKSTEATSLGNLSDANPAAWRVSMEKTIKAFPNPQFVIPGHQDWRDKQSLQYTLKLLKAHAAKKP
jgi:metallo-beta-lactamase class B